MIFNNIEYFGGIFGKSEKDTKNKLDSNKLNLLNLNCKNTRGKNYVFDRDYNGARNILLRVCSHIK
jgi:hypothetical protein